MAETELIDPASKTILIVDDDDSIRDLIEFVLRKEGFKTDKAPDGQEALTRIGVRRPDLVILDLMMPRYGGFEVLRKLQMGEGVSVPIVVISGKFTDRTTRDMIAQESNVVEFLEKPIRPPQLTAVAHRILKTRPAELKDADEKKRETGPGGP